MMAVLKKWWTEDAVPRVIMLALAGGVGGFLVSHVLHWVSSHH